MSNARGTAKPLHTIIRYRPDPIGYWSDWRPVEILRYRLFVNATHAEVTGDDSRGGAPWDHDWSCESLSHPSEGPLHWRINGRNEWPTPAVALAELERSTVATYAEAFEIAIGRLVRERDAKQRSAERLSALIESLRTATAPELPA